jgi:phosphohistidine phosphatase
MVSDLTDLENVLIVGHNPNLPIFMGSLIASPSRAAIRVRKGAIARIDCARRPGTLHWLVDPRILMGVYGQATRTVRKRVINKP